MTTPVQERRERRRKILNRTRLDDRFQFGQPAAGRTLIPEGNACGAAVAQRVVKLWTGRDVTMNRVVIESDADPDSLWGRDGTNGGRGRGLFTSELMRALQRLVPKAKYHAISDMEDPRALLNYARYRGPVIFIARYGNWPEWKGYRYLGKLADGKPNGYARPLGDSGKTQLSGFEDGAHYGLLLSSRYNGTEKPETAWLYDSNHGSSLRPEKPRWDTLDGEQFSQLYLSGRRVTTVRRTWAAYPEASL